MLNPFKPKPKEPQEYSPSKNFECECGNNYFIPVYRFFEELGYLNIPHYGTRFKCEKCGKTYELTCFGLEEIKEGD